MEIVFSYLKMFLISLATGFGLGFGFWTAHLTCKRMIKIILIFLFLSTPTYAEEVQEMKFISMEEAEDCPSPSYRIERVDKETGEVSYVVKSPCEFKKEKGKHENSNIQ